jgi:hypothetical protein
MACRKFINQVRAGIASAIAGSRRGVAEATVKVHRRTAMQKQGDAEDEGRALPKLGRMADRLKLVLDEPERS